MRWDAGTVRETQGVFEEPTHLLSVKLSCRTGQKPQVYQDARHTGSI